MQTEQVIQTEQMKALLMIEACSEACRRGKYK